ncbi:beta-1,3-glucanase, partial [Candidatus Scalindua japonica]
MLKNNAFSPFRNPGLSCIHTLSFIFILALILFISTTNIYAAQVTLEWDSNTEPDIDGYKIHFGNSSRNYDSITDVGNQTSYTVKNLVEEQVYYFAVTAYDKYNNESDYSAEVFNTVQINNPPVLSSIG